jgi:hypothetical protein
MCSDTNCWGFRRPHARTGGVLIFAHRRVKHTDTIFYVVRQNRLHPRERVIVLGIEKGLQQIHGEEEDYITLLNSSTLSSCSCCHCSSLSLHSLAHTHVLSLSLCSKKHDSFIGKYGEPLQHTCQSWWDKKALNHATISGTNGATTCLVVGYCH